MNRRSANALYPSGFTRYTPTVEVYIKFDAGVTAVIVVLFRTRMLAGATATLLNCSVSPDTKPVPVIVTGVPPVIGPELGVTAVSVGNVGVGTGAGAGIGGGAGGGVSGGVGAGVADPR